MGAAKPGIIMLSRSDKSRFEILYRELSNKELAIIFNTNEDVVVETAKSLGIYQSKIHDSNLWYRKNLTNL